MKKIRLILYVVAGVALYLGAALLLTLVENHPNSNIKDFGDAFWYSIVTIASVGYGDKFPVTLLGKLVGGTFVFASIITLTILISKFAVFVINLRERRKMGFNGTKFEDHIIILGWDSFAKSIVNILIDTGNKVAIITNNKDDIDHIIESYPKEKHFVLYSGYDNYPFFTNANIEKSKFIFINLASDTDKLVAILNLKHAYPKCSFMVSLNNSKLKETFENAGVTYLISKDEIASKLIASYIFEQDVANFSIDILSDSKDNDDYDIQQFKVTPQLSLIGHPIGELTDLIKNKNIKSLIVAIAKNKDNTREIIKLPEPDVLMDEGDFVIFINNFQSSQDISKLFGISQGFK